MRSKNIRIIGNLFITRYPLFILSFLSSFLVGCHEENVVSKPPSPPPAVSLITISPKDVPVFFEYIAQTQSSQLVNIQARVNGYLDRRVYMEGSVVQAGEILFELDAKPYKASLDQALAVLSQQKAAYETARLDYNRIKALAEQKVATPKDLDDATGKYLTSAAAVEQASAQVETAKLNLSYTTITSPVTGVSGSARQAEGTYINQQNNQLTEITVLSPMWVNFSLTESEILKYKEQIAKGLLIPPKDEEYEVEVIRLDGSIFPHTGRITFAEPSFNAQTGTFLVRTSVDNPDGTLRPNQNVHVRLKGAVRPNSILVPQRSVQESSRGQFVWVMDKDHRVEQRPVIIGKWHGNDWFILEGLVAGDQVVTDGVLRLRSGMTVTAKPLEAGNVPMASSEAKTPPAAVSTE